MFFVLTHKLSLLLHSFVSNAILFCFVLFCFMWKYMNTKLLVLCGLKIHEILYNSIHNSTTTIYFPKRLTLVKTEWKIQKELIND